MVVVTTAGRNFAVPFQQQRLSNPAVTSQNDLLQLKSKLRTLDRSTLEGLQQSFFETAQGSKASSAGAGASAFGAKSPGETVAANLGFAMGGYAAGPASSKPFEENSSDGSPSFNSDSTLQRQKERGFVNHSKGPGVFSNPAAEKAAEAARNSQAQTQNFLANQLGTSFARGDMKNFLGPNTCFEDVLAEVMMRIADQSEKEMMEQIRVVEKGEGGLNGFLANGARSLGGAAGGALGGYLGGVQGAAIGHDVGERVVGSVANQYGGSSRQVQFERLKLMIHKQSEMMSAISNILATIHSTNKNAISNMRG